MLLILGCSGSSARQIAERHLAARIHALEQRDLTELEALYEGKPPSEFRGLLDASEAAWDDKVRLLSACTFGPVHEFEPGRIRADESCTTTRSEVVFHKVGEVWLEQSRQHGPVRNPWGHEMYRAWRTPGPPIPGIEVPPVPIEVEVSPVYQLTTLHTYTSRETPASLPLLATIGQIAAPCETLQDFTGTQGAWKTRPLPGPLQATLQIHPLETGCLVQVFWEAPVELQVPFPYGCVTEDCRRRRGEIPPAAPYAHPFTEEDLKKHHRALLESLGERDLDRVLALFTENHHVGWQQYANLPDKRWKEEQARRAACRVSEIQVRGPDTAQLVEVCPGSRLNVAYTRDGQGWRRREWGSFAASDMPRQDPGFRSPR